MKLAIFAALAATAVAQVAQETTVTGADGTLTSKYAALAAMMVEEGPHV